ncbi:MAG: hypothetical protein AAF829_05570 [Pseudomonadota bacterium]
MVNWPDPLCAPRKEPEYKDVAVVPYDQSGRDFWHVDFYRDGTFYDEMDGWACCEPSPDGYATTERGATEADAVALARKSFPKAIIRICDDD